MDWKLILQLSLFGLAMGLGTVFFIGPGIEPILWLVIFGLCAYIIARSSPRKRPEERKRARQRTRREMLLWGGGIFGFLAILYYIVRDTGPKPDAP